MKQNKIYSDILTHTDGFQYRIAYSYDGSFKSISKRPHPYWTWRRAPREDFDDIKQSIVKLLPKESLDRLKDDGILC